MHCLALSVTKSLIAFLRLDWCDPGLRRSRSISKRHATSPCLTLMLMMTELLWVRMCHFKLPKWDETICHNLNKYKLGLINSQSTRLIAFSPLCLWQCFVLLRSERRYNTLYSIKSAHSAIGGYSQRASFCIGAKPLKKFPFLEWIPWRISQRRRNTLIMRRQDLVRDLVRSEEPQSRNTLEIGNELSLKPLSDERRPNPRTFFENGCLCQKVEICLLKCILMICHS